MRDWEALWTYLPIHDFKIRGCLVVTFQSGSTIASLCSQLSIRSIQFTTLIIIYNTFLYHFLYLALNLSLFIISLLFTVCTSLPVFTLSPCMRTRTCLSCFVCSFFSTSQSVFGLLRYTQSGFCFLFVPWIHGYLILRAFCSISAVLQFLLFSCSLLLLLLVWNCLFWLFPRHHLLVFIYSFRLRHLATIVGFHSFFFNYHPLLFTP